MAKLVIEDAKSFIARKDATKLVKNLFLETYSDHFQEEDVFTAMKKQVDLEAYFIIAEDDQGQIQGVASYYYGANSFFTKVIIIEQFIYVFPEYRKSSIYFRLIKKMVQIAKGSIATEFYIGSSNVDFAEREQYYQMLQHIGFTEAHRSYVMKV